MRIDFFSQGLLVKSTFEDVDIFEDSLYILCKANPKTEVTDWDSIFCNGKVVEKSIMHRYKPIDKYLGMDWIMHKSLHQEERD